LDMFKSIAFCLLLLATRHDGAAQALAIPTLRILPEDVVPVSIQQIKMATNKFVVRWTYTEAGARKMLAFREANEGQKTRMGFGAFEFPPSENELSFGIFEFAPAEKGFSPTPLGANYRQWKEGWMKRRTDKVSGLSEADAKAIAAGLKGN
jgi:hypothetical protein